MALFDTVPSGVSGAPDNIFQSAPANWWDGAGAADPSAWSRIMNAVQSKEGQNLLGTLGKAATGAAGGGNDANYLKIAAGNPPFSQGVPPTLLLSLLQMQQQAQQAQLPQLGVPRASLLG